MQIALYPPKNKFSKCLVLVGGSGDTSEGFLPLVIQLNKYIPDLNICTFTFSSRSEKESILDIQSAELAQVMETLTKDHGYKSINIFATSMGAYATIKLLSSGKYVDTIDKVIFFDPADYYLSAKFGDSNDVTWSGSQAYLPTNEVVSNELRSVVGGVKISVVHLTLRNYGVSGYLKESYEARGEDDPSGYPRLNTDMVKSLYGKIPQNNRGKYIEVPDVPHAMLRDGNIENNHKRVVQTLADILSPL